MESGTPTVAVVLWKVGVAVVLLQSGGCSSIWKVGVAVVYGKWVSIVLLQHPLSIHYCEVGFQ